MQKLAIHGGTPVIRQPLQPHNPISDSDIFAANQVMKSGQLSGFLAAAGESFFGGPKVRQLEAAIARMDSARSAVSFNSWTSGLVAILNSLGLETGDEVLTTPWTMCATASAIVSAGAVPRFVDIDPDTFNLDMDKVAMAITEKTRAIVVVDIFGRPCDRLGLRRLHDRWEIAVIADCAQAPLYGAPHSVDNSFLTAWGYSFNFHKHIHSGEGGIALTNDAGFFDQLTRYRNHGEILGLERNDVQSVGYNLRLGEVEAALLVGQIDRLGDILQSRKRAARTIASSVAHLTGLHVNLPEESTPHAYYILGFRLSGAASAFRREIVDALRAEGVPGVLEGYQNLHKIPAFRFADSLPSAEDLHNRTFLGLYLCGNAYSDEECHLVGQAFAKVWANLVT